MDTAFLLPQVSGPVRPAPVLDDVQAARSQARKQRSERGSSLGIEMRSVVDHEVERLAAKLGGANSIQRRAVGLIYTVSDEDASVALTGSISIQRWEPDRRKLDADELLGREELVVQNDTATLKHADVDDSLDRPSPQLRKMRLDKPPVLAQDKTIAHGPPLLQHRRQAEFDLDVPVVNQVIGDPRNPVMRIDAF